MQISHIQTSPVCRKKSDFYEVNPILEHIKKLPKKFMNKLGIISGNLFFLITTGGISQEYSFQEKIKKERFFLHSNWKFLKK